MRIFIDVGAHYGETLHVVLDPNWGFDRIFALEPASLCTSILKGFRDPRLVIEQVALSNREGREQLYGAGLLGASLYADKKQVVSAGIERLDTETITLVRATDWFRSNISSGAEVFLKMNCEGSEADILEDLLDSGTLRTVTSVYVDFDIRKIPSEAHRQTGIERRLQDAGINYLSTDALCKAGNAGVREWLKRSCRPIKVPLRARLRHSLHFDAPPYEQMKMLVRMIVPRKVYWWVGRRFGRIAQRGGF